MKLNFCLSFYTPWMAELGAILHQDISSLLFLESCALGAIWSSTSSTRQVARWISLYLSPSALMGFSDTFMLHLRTWKSFCSFQAMVRLRNFFSSPFPKLWVKKLVAKTLLLGSMYSHIYSLKILLSLVFSWGRVFSSLRK